MTRLAFRLLLAALVITATGSAAWCESTPDTEPEEAPPAVLDTSLSPSGEVLQRFEVRLSQQRLDSVWPELFGYGVAPTLAPSLGLEPGTLVVYSMGARPGECYATEIVSVRARGEGFVLELNEVAPAPGCTCNFSGADTSQVRRLAGPGGPVTLCVRRPSPGC